MNVLDLIIIYLACGSPFGVYQITKRQPVRSGVEWLKIALWFLCWPAFAANLLFCRFVHSDERASVEGRRRIEEIRTDIERLAFADVPISLLFEFREVFYRFTGLSEAVNAPVVQTTNQLAEVTGHPDRSLAASCLARRNGNRLAFHLAGARSEFVDLISHLATNAASRDGVVGLTLELAEQLREPDMKTDINAVLTAQPKPTVAPATNIAKEELRSIAHTTSI